MESNQLLSSLEFDLQEITKFIEDSKRANITRLLEGIKTNIEKQIDTEKQKFPKKVENVETTLSNSKPKIIYEPISKYLWNNGEKYVTYINLN